MPESNTEQRKLAAIMFTDMVGYSALSQRNEALALELLEEHRRVVRGLLSKHSGREVKTTGDGFLLEFPSALAAVQGAVNIQSALYERNQISPLERQLHIRIGIHVGDVVMRDGDIHGDGVNIAARIEPLAQAGGICISSAVHEQVRNKLSQPMAVLGAAELKNIELAMVVHRVVLPWESSASSRRESAPISAGKSSQSRLTSAATKIGFAVVVLLLALGIIWWFNNQGSQATKQVTASPSATNPPANPPTVVSAKVDQNSIAVLAFADMSAEKDSEYFADGISEELLNVLAKIPGLKVTARTSAFHFKGKDTSIADIGKQLGVAYVVEGSVRKSGNRVRITAQLIKADDSFHLWSENFDRDLKDIFAVQDEIASLIAKNLSTKLGTATLLAGTSAMPTANLAAYDAYLRGRALQTGSTPIPLDRLRPYEEAVRLDPNFALAWARLSQTYSRLRRLGYDRSEQNATKARDAAATALRLIPDLPEAHLAMALVRLYFDYDHDATQRELDHTERLRPNDPEVPAARVRLELARGQRGDGLVALIERAVALDPLNATAFYEMGRVLQNIGRYADANRLHLRSWELSQNSFRPIMMRVNNYQTWTGDVGGALDILETIPERFRNHPDFYGERGNLLEMRGDLEQAIAAYERTRTNLASFGSGSGGSWRDVLLTLSIGRIEARLGRGKRAAELYAEALNVALKLSEDFSDDAVVANSLAIIRATRGERTEALAAMDEALRMVARTKDATRVAGARETKARVLSLLGETDAAIAELRALHEMGWPFGYNLRLGIQWEPLHTNPKFQQLMKDAEARADAQPRPPKK